jgi:hypothetical protein
MPPAYLPGFFLRGLIRIRQSGGMLCALVLAWPLAAQQPATPATPVDAFAMTKSGVQIEVSELPVRGQLDIKTPYGIFRTPTDPVEIVFERARDRTWQALIRTTPDASLVSIIEALAANGQISALLELAPAVLARGHEDETRITLNKLEEWGARVDPVPSDLDREDRLEWLAAQRKQTKGPAQLLWNARYLAELPTPSTVDKQRIARERGGWSERFEQKEVLEARLELQIAAHYLEDDPRAGLYARQLSLYGAPALLDVAGATTVTLWPGMAREFWVAALLREQEPVRIIAAKQLMRHLPEYAPKPFAYLLAAEEHTAPRRFEFLEQSVQLVSKQEPPSVHGGWFQDCLDRWNTQYSSNRSFPTVSYPDRNEYLEMVSTVKLIKMSDALRTTVLESLGLLANDDVPRSIQEWLTWYAAQQQSP